MKHVITFNHPGDHDIGTFWNAIGVKNPMIVPTSWGIELDKEQLLRLRLTYPDADIYKSLREE